MVRAVVITGIKPPVKIRPNKKLGITDELAKEINKYRLIKQEADILNKSLESYGYDTAKQLKYERYANLYENHLEYLHNKPKTDVSDGKIKSQTQIKKDVKIVTVSKNAKELADAVHRYIKDVAIAKELGITLADIGYTQELIDIFENKLKQHGLDSQKLATKMLENAGLTAVVATQAPATKEYNDSSSSSFKSKKSVYDSIPSTRSAGVMSRVSSPETFKNGVVNMARTMDASAKQISKLLKMDAKLLEELYYDKPFLFDLYFEYSLYDDFAPSHEDSGINKLIESYEYKYGVTL